MQQALRTNKEFEEADRIRKKLLVESGGAMITLVHATRGRPKKAAAMRKLWLDLAENPGSIEHIFVIDVDDEESIPLYRMHHIVIKNGGGSVQAWNTGAGLASGKIIIQMSDDLIPPPRWDQLIIDKFVSDYEKSISDRVSATDSANGSAAVVETASESDIEKRKRRTLFEALNQPRVLAINDSVRTDKLLCHAICTNAYFHQDAFLFHPDFLSMYSDNYFTDLAYQRGQVIEARDLVFKHDHPIVNKQEPDRTYLEQNAPDRFSQGEQIYAELRQGRDWSHVPGWFNFWPFYRQVAKLLNDGDCVAEVGVWLGRSIIYLAQACRKAGKDVKFYAVDHFKGEKDQPAHESTIKEHGGSIRAAFERNIAKCGIADMITILEGDSAQMANQVEDGSLAFCFIDAAHDYDSAKRDIEAWLPKVKGTIAGHDIQHGPVKRAVTELIDEPVLLGSVWMKKLTATKLELCNSPS